MKNKIIAALLFITMFGITFAGCGQKSVIKETVHEGTEVTEETEKQEETTDRVYIGSNSSSLVTCPGCGKKVSRLITKRDVAGESRTWCSDCWAEYDWILGR